MAINNIVIFFNGERGLSLLDFLLEEGKNIVAAVVPEKSSFWNISNKYHHLKLIKSSKLHDLETIKILASFNSDLFIVAGFSTIFKQEIISLPRIGIINLHGGPLPKYRGGSPLNWQIINDESHIGISLIFMDKGIDTGDVIAQANFPLEDTDDINSVHQKANITFRTLVSSVLNQIEKNTLSVTKQDESKAQYWTQRIEQESYIDWNRLTARQVFNKIRALKSPYPSAFTMQNDKKIFLYEATLPAQTIRGTPGRIVYLGGRGPYVICSDKAILILKASQKLINGTSLNAIK